MPKNKKKSIDNSIKGMVKNALAGALFGTLVFFLLTLIASALCLKKDFEQSTYGYFEIAISIISGLLCGYFSVKKTRRKAVISGGVSTLPMYLAVSCTAAILSESGIGIIGWIVGVAMLLSGTVGGIFAVR